MWWLTLWRKFFAREKEERKKKRGNIIISGIFFALPDLPIYGVLDDDGSVATWRTESALFIYSTFLLQSSWGEVRVPYCSVLCFGV